MYIFKVLKELRYFGTAIADREIYSNKIICLVSVSSIRKV